MPIIGRSSLQYRTVWRDGHYVGSLFNELSNHVVPANIVRMLRDPENGKAYLDEAAASGFALPVPDRIVSGASQESNNVSIYCTGRSTADFRSNDMLGNFEADVVVRPGKQGDLQQQFERCSAYLAVVQRILRTCPPAEFLFGWPADRPELWSSEFDLTRGVQVEQIDAIPANQLAQYESGLRIRLTIQLLLSEGA